MVLSGSLDDVASKLHDATVHAPVNVAVGDTAMVSEIFSLLCHSAPPTFPKLAKEDATPGPAIVARWAAF